VAMNPKKTKKKEEDQNIVSEANVSPEPVPEETSAAEAVVEAGPPPHEVGIPPLEAEAPSLEQEIESLKKDLEEANALAAEYLDGWQRARAEFANYKKRVDRDQLIAHQTAAGNILKRFLDVSDDLERALKNRPQDGDGAVWANGIDLVYRKLHAILEAEGLKVIQAEGEFFDPGLHEAISHEESPAHESGQVIGVVQPGYLLGDRVLRPARVRVAR